MILFLAKRKSWVKIRAFSRSTSLKHFPMPRPAKAPTVQSSSARPAPVASRPRKRKYTRKELRERSVAEFAALRPPGGARILTRAEVMADMPPLKPGEQSAHEWLREMMAPIREYNIWCAENGIEVQEEMDPSLMEERDK